MTKKLGLQAILLLLGVGLLVGVRAQTNTVGNISGIVHDPQGATIPNAEVVIAAEGTGFSRTVKADSDGFYSAPSLPVGVYSVSTAPQGFKKTIVTGVELHISENRVVNLDLQIGQVTETVTVTSESAAVETRSGGLSSLISDKQVTELPLNGRNYAALALGVPGVSAGNAGGAAFNARGTGLDSHVDMSVNGNQSNANMWTVDGVNNMDVGSNATLLVFPSIDSIQEFRVERNSFSAEFGQAQGAVINLVTKGGSNQFHGTGFFFLRDDSLNANTFFLNRSGLPKPPLKYKNFGGNFSGPIIKNRVFFFWNEEWRREKRSNTLSAKVPTAAEKGGDFSGVLTGPLPYVPGTCQIGSDGKIIRSTCTNFPGNKIPANQLSPAALSILKVYPDPNSTGSGNNWNSSSLQPVNTRQDSIRGDANITSKTSLMVRFIKEKWVHGAASGNFWGDSPFPTLSSDWEQPSKSFAIRLTNSFSSSAVNEFQFSRAGNDIFIVTTAAGQAVNDEIRSKFPTVFPRPEGYGLPAVNGTDGYATLQHQAPWTNHEDLFIWKDDFSKVVGSHDLKFGTLFSHNIKNELNAGASGTAGLNMTNTRTGNAIADLLLKDLPLSGYGEIDHVENTLGRWHDLEFYGNDKWKVRPNVTLNLGLRWSKFSPAYSNDDRVSNYIPRLYDGTNPLSGLVKAGTGGFNRATVKPYNKGFQPRLGLAWDVSGDGKTALRLGFGRFSGRANVIEDLLRMAANPPWTVNVSTSVISPSSTLTSNPGNSTDPNCNACRSLDTINAGVKNNVAGVGPTTGFNAVSENFRPPDSYQWNLTISREILKNTVAEISYVGNHGLHLWRRGVNFNDVVPSARAAIAVKLQNGQNVDSDINNNRRLKGVGPITMSESTGDSSYHALQAWVNRRVTNRLAFQAAYTWAHAISNIATASFSSTTTDPFNYDLDRGNADLDRRQMFTFNVVYNLPTFSGVRKHILGDWQLNLIGALVGGAPLDITSGADTPGLAAAPSFRPNVVQGVPIYLNSGGDPLQWLNPAAFSLPAAGQFGSLGRGVIRQPASQNFDIAIAKNWRFGERYNFQFRTEMFNAFNHANFTGVVTNAQFQNLRTATDFGKIRDSNFGRITGTLAPREIQFGFKFSF
jgi:hypothetical protein